MSLRNKFALGFLALLGAVLVTSACTSGTADAGNSDGGVKVYDVQNKRGNNISCAVISPQGSSIAMSCVYIP